MDNRDLAIESDVHKYLYTNKLVGYLHFSSIKMVAKNLGNGKILDLGCDDGKLVNYLNHLPHYKYIGVDINEAFLKRASYLHPGNGTFIKADVCKKLPFTEKSFDYITAIAVFEHFNDLDSALKEMRRVLSDDGKIIVVIPSENWLWGLGRKLTTKRYIESKYDVDYEKWVREKQHVNTTKEIFEKSKKYFKVRKRHNFPFKIPLSIYFELSKK